MPLPDKKRGAREESSSFGSETSLEGSTEGDRFALPLVGCCPCKQLTTEYAYRTHVPNKYFFCECYNIPCIYI